MSKSVALEGYTVQAAEPHGTIDFRCTVCGRASEAAEVLSLADFIEFYWKHECAPLTTN